MEISCKSKPRLLGFGISLLDIIVDGSQELLDKYGLVANGEVRASGALLSIFDEVSKLHRDSLYYRPGGATLNALRVAQWCLGEEGHTTVVSCVSNDSRGESLRQAMVKAGVDALFQVNRQEPTGSCLVICSGTDNRSLVTYGGASYLFTIDFFDQEETKAAIDDSQYFYCSGYSLIGCPDAVKRLAVHASNHTGKVFAINMAAVYVCQQYCSRLKDVLPTVDVLFGNEAEASAFSQACGLQASSSEDIAVELSLWERQGVHRPPRVVVVTQGSLPAVLAVDGKVTKCPPAPISESEIVDANGAGDAFVGGFLSSLMQGQAVERAMLSGHHAAREVLRHRGCDLPEKPITSGSTKLQGST